MRIKNGRTDNVFREGRSNLNSPLQCHSTARIAPATTTSTVRLVSFDGADTLPDFIDVSLRDIIPGNSCISAPDALEPKEIISLLVERIAQLPNMQKKVLAMYYYENMQLSDIAAIFGVTESRISQIRWQAVAVLRKYLTKLFLTSRK